MRSPSFRSRTIGHIPCAAAILLVGASQAWAQEVAGPVTAPRVVAGIVTTGEMPVEGANVFLLETLEGAVTGPEGRFRFRTSDAGPVTLVVRHLGYEEQRRRVPDGSHDTLVITMRRVHVALQRVEVLAGRYTADETRGSTLTPLEVVTTPGTTAEVFRALQTLPGVQAADEGSALFVRGGDYTETKIYLDGAEVLVPVRLQRHTGTFIGSVDPFLLEGIVFSSGGFGARHGNALSGVAALRTLGRPSRASATASAGLAALSLTAAMPVGEESGIRVAANAFDLEPMFAVNGRPRAYSPPPRGSDLSGSLHHDYSSTGRIRAFALRQTNRFGVAVEDAALAGTFVSDAHSGLAVLTWRDVLGRALPVATISHSVHESDETLSDFALRTRYALTHGAFQLDVTAPADAVVRMGAELDRLTARLAGVLASGDRHPADEGGEPSIDQAEVMHRFGAFTELDWQPHPAIRIVPGIRVDRAMRESYTGVTLDPRAAASIAIAHRATLTAAWGIYHQLPDLLLYATPLGDPELPSMRAVQQVIGVQVDGEDGSPVARAELYRKRYSDLAQLTRDHATVGGGQGSAAGLDLFARGALVLGLSGRLTYSAVRARRTDPHTGARAAAPFDITHTIGVIAERGWRGGWRTAASVRAASGRPTTPVVGAEPVAVEDGGPRWVPRFGPPYSERLPPLSRVDLTASRVQRLSDGMQLVGFLAVTNVLDRRNVHSWRYSADYSERAPVRSIFARSLYIGASISASRLR